MKCINYAFSVFQSLNEYKRINEECDIEELKIKWLKINNNMLIFISFVVF